MLATDPGPIQSRRQQAELLSRHRHRTVPDWWPNELARLQPLRGQDHAGAIPINVTQAIKTLRAEDEHIATIGIGRQR